MKHLLKGQIPKEYRLDYELTFSEQKTTIYEKLIPELKRLMEGNNFNPSVTQLSNWLQSIHKHRRDRLRKRTSGKLSKVDRRLHKNSRLMDVSIFYKLFLYCSCLIINLWIIWQKKNRRVKSALKLFDMKDEAIEQFDKDELLSILQKKGYHSTEISESEDEFGTKTSGKNFLHVYDHPWRSNKVNIIYVSAINTTQFTLSLYF